MLFAFIGLYRGGLAVFAADAAGSAANGTAPAAIVSVAAAGSKGNAVALEPVLLLCVSSAVGRKYAALSAAVSGAVCSDTGIIWRIVIALSGVAKIAGSLDINKGTLEHRTT